MTNSKIQGQFREERQKAWTQITLIGLCQVQFTDDGVPILGFI